MDLHIARDPLLRALYLAQGIADRKSTQPILQHTLIRAAKGRAFIAATDLHVTGIADVAANVTEDGGITVAARQIYDITKAMSGAEIHLRTGEKGWLEVRCGRSEFKVAGLSDRDYPELPSIGGVALRDMDPAVLRDMIAKTLFSVSTDDTRQHIAGVLFVGDGEDVRMVSTDGHRLSMVDRHVEGGLSLGRVLIPRKGVVELRRLIETRDNKCEIGVKDGNIFLRADDLVVAVRLSDSTFLPYEQVIPKADDAAKLICSREALIETLGRVGLMAPDKTQGLRFSASAGKLAIEAESPELGHARERIDVEYEGAPVSAGFNGRYWAELLGEMGCPEVEIVMRSETDPATVRPADASSYMGVIMPLRL